VGKLLASDEEERKEAFDRTATFPADIAKKSLVMVQVDSTGINNRAIRSWTNIKVGFEEKPITEF
jgi:hypothetical protein